MRLIGMLDSPYVRRTAIALHALGIPFEHEALSVFSDTEKLAAINPVLKVPSLVCDDGIVLMDSSLIIDYLARSQPVTGSLEPDDKALWQLDICLTGLALAACDKAVQRVYEDRVRPEDKRYAPWVERVESQLSHAWTEIEKRLSVTAFPASENNISLGIISTVVAWTFCTHMLPDLSAGYLLPSVHDLSADVESLPLFKAYAFPVAP